MEHRLQDGVPPDRPGGKVGVSRHDHEDLRITYSTLRWMMIGFPLMLLLVTFFYASRVGGWEDSISAYYGGPIRDVLVGSIIATAACMVAYRGWFALEDFALNAAGFFAVFVALVPAGLDTIMRDLRDHEAAMSAAVRTDGGLSSEVPAALARAELPFTAEEYGWSLRYTLTAVAVLCAVLLWKERNRSRRRTSDLLGRGGWGRPIVLCTGLSVFGFIIVAYSQLWAGPASEVTLPGIPVGPFHLEVHALAAILMIASLMVVVATHGWPQEAAAGDPKRTVLAPDHDLRHVYRLISGLMSIGALCLLGLGLMFFDQYIVLILEWYEILLFCCFWFLETRRVSRCYSAG